MAREIILGIDCQVIYLPTARRVPATPIPQNPWDQADYVAADWKEITTVRDVTLNLSFSTADVTTRAAEGWRQTVPTLNDASIDFAIRWTPDDDSTNGIIFRDLLDRAIDKCPVCMIFLDGEIDVDESLGGNWYDHRAGRCGDTGDRSGLFADFAITNFTRNENLEEGVFADVTVVPTVGLIYPEWIYLAAS